MKVKLILLICAILSGCSNEGTVSLDTSRVKSITKTYGENVYTQAMYFISLGEYKGENLDTQNMRSYAEGFKLGLRRRDLYQSIDHIVSEGLSYYYDKDTVLRITELNTKLALVSANVTDFIILHDNTSHEENNELADLKEEIKDLVPYLYPDDEGTEITLYTLITNPSPLAENHTQEQIHAFLDQLDDKLDKILLQVNQYKRP
ncbi:hypothetical protein ACQKK5_14530 [Brevibacillus panacihumi]|uniref:hypothetical protein n=1 Tax=Brevibacillus panacihumi TaxID=497735 RepID=UPI003CFF8850